MEPVLDVKGLRVAFQTNDGEVQAVRGIDLSVMPGETVASWANPARARARPPWR